MISNPRPLTLRQQRIRERLSTEYAKQLRDLVNAQSIPLVALVGINFATAAILGPTGKGQASFCITTASLLSTFLFLSLYVGAVHAHRSGDHRGILRALGVTAVIAGSLVGLGVTLDLLSIRVGPSYLTSELDALTLTGTGILVMNLFVLRALQGLGHSRLYRNIIAVGTLSYVVVVLFLLELRLTPGEVVSAWNLGNALSAILGLIILHRVSGPWWGRSQPKLARGDRVQVLRASLAAHLGSTGQQVLYRADLVTLGLLGTASQVGIYALAVAVAELLWVLAEAISLLTFSRGTNVATPADRLVIVRQDLRTYSRLAIIPMLAVGALCDPVIHWLLPQYARAVPAILLLLPGVWFGGRIRILLSAAIAADRRKVTMLAGAYALLVSVVYVPMIKVWGLDGAAAASSIAYFLQAMILSRLLSRGLEQS